MAFEFNNPLLYELREGSALDPYASKVDTSVITNNKIILSELPDQFSGITIPNYSESKSPSDLISTSFYCNYLNGTLSFSSTENGKTVTATYLGRGIIAIPAERIYTKSVDGSSTETFQQVADNVGNASTVLSNLSSSISTGNVTNSNLISSISTANSTKTDLNNMNIIAIETEASLSSANVVASEATRIQNESQRLLNEGIRVNSEVTRVSAENIRKSAEEIRIPAEVNRNNAESARLIAENLRIAQNNNSISAENIRIASENERIDEEVVRQDNENTRLSQESSRVIAESSRVGVENTRVSQELSRVGVENTRVTSENIRLASEISRVGVESARVSAENIRESNEETRISQENTREINEDSRISDESNREANELTRISQENIRESQEENRQSTYSSGHINFKGIVTGIASLPASDNILGDTYQVIDDAITANNAMWRYNGTIFEKSYVLDLTFAGGYGANNSQVFTATANQTVFTLTEFPYLIGVNQLMVYVTGIKQIIGVNYTETSTNSFTLTSGVVAGTKVEAFRSVPGGAGSLTTQEVENARVSSLGVGYANLKARIDAHDFEKVGVLSGLPTVAKTDIVSSINEFYDDVEEYKAENAHVSLSSFPIIVPEIDDSARFKRAIDQALVDKRGLMIPYSYLEISQGDIALNYPIEILGLGSNSTPIADSKYQTVIRYSGIAPLFTIDVPNFTHWSGFSFRKFRFISETGAGGFITINKDKIMLTPPNVQPCGPFNRGLFEDVQFEKVYIDTTPATLDGAVCIDGVALFNNVFNRCEFVGWDLVVNTPQSDINLFKKCLFTRNVQIAKFKNLNTYGSQNRFHHCDFEIRRLGVEAFYQFEDYAKYTSWNDCYFEVGGTPSGVKPKGWFDFNGGAWHKVIEGRFDIIPSRIETEFCCITSASFGVTFEHCTASDFNTDVSKNAYIEPRFKTNGYSTQSHRGVQFIGCSPQFLSYFDLKNSSATHYSSKWGTIHKTKDDARPKRIIYNVHNFDETSETMYTTEKDDLSLTGYVFKLKKTTSVGMGAVVDGLYFDFLVNNSIVKTGGMYKVKIRAKNTTAGQAAKLRAKIVRLSSAKAFVSSIGVHYEQAGTAEGYYETTLNIKQTGVDAGSGQSTVWNTGEYVRVYIHAHDGVGTDAVDTGILIDSVEIEEVQPYIYLAGSDGNMYIVDINTTDSTLRVVKKATAEEVYPSSTY